MIDKRITLNDLKKKAPKGEFLAYINKEEAAALKRAGGSGHLVNGIPSFVGSDYSGDKDSKGNVGTNTSGYQGGNRGTGGYQGSKGGINSTSNTGNDGNFNPNVTAKGTTITTGDLSSDTQKYNHYETISKNTGVDINPLRPSGIKPGYIKPGDIDGLNLRPYEQQRVDFLNTPYKGIDTPFPLINTIGNTIGKFGYDTNKQFFA